MRDRTTKLYDYVLFPARAHGDPVASHPLQISLDVEIEGMVERVWRAWGQRRMTTCWTFLMRCTYRFLARCRSSDHSHRRGSSAGPCPPHSAFASWVRGTSSRPTTDKGARPVVASAWPRWGTTMRKGTSWLGSHWDNGVDTWTTVVLPWWGWAAATPSNLASEREWQPPRAGDHCSNRFIGARRKSYYSLQP
jgi:hypothetical protein